MQGGKKACRSPRRLRAATTRQLRAQAADFALEGPSAARRGGASRATGQNASVTRTADAVTPLAVALLSGGLDSAVAAASVVADGRDLHTLAIDYGQRCHAEFHAAHAVSASLGALTHRVVRVDLRALGGSALTSDVAVPKGRNDHEIGAGVPVTYVPARNTVLLSIALGLAEVVGAEELVIGANALDYSGYPDCRGPYLRAFEELAQLATAAGTERGVRFRVRAPLLDMSKADIVRHGLALGVPLSATMSCYDPLEQSGEWLHCGECDSCALRRRGFREAAAEDPTRYAPELGAGHGAGGAG